MAALDDALDRLARDPLFRAEVLREPAVALRHHALGPDELPSLLDAARALADGAT